MKTSLVVLIICLAGAITAQVQPLTWKVNLDLPPEERWPWTEMIPIYRPYLNAALGMIGQFIPPSDQWIFEDVAAEIVPFMGDYGGEIISGAKQINVSVGVAVLLNIIYDVEAYCTSIVARTSNGTIIHGRNLDFNLAPVLRNLTINVEFQRSGKTVYTGTTYAGYVGLPTGMKPGKFGISMDERDKGSLLENILEAFLVEGTTGPTFLIRDTLDKFDSFNDAIKNLASVPLAAPVYFIVSGIKSDEGAVVTRDRDGPVDIWRLNDTRWFEVETNYDHWKPAGDHRRAVAIAGMEKLGQQKVSLYGIFDVLSTEPVLNNQTTYTTLMNPTDGYYISYIR